MLLWHFFGPPLVSYLFLFFGVIIIYNILKLKFDPIGFIYNPKMVYVGFEYHELFNIFKANLLNNYLRVAAFMWVYFLIYYYLIHYKKVTEIEN